ncbi:MmgE/PrpD family protein [Enterobacteriales bacterium SAP-6]|uniref:MmgE/PrpD family protein n=2 Tax=Acerihabitans arboris TaxID=2691583 RepID=A0A845SEX4_9GAMM|nr:MmgE/PrpD family protein [Acerihabitans arboris]
MATGGARRLADWLAALAPADIPDAVNHVALRCLVDTLGVMLAGAATPVAGMARRVAALNAADGGAAVAGASGRYAAPSAAFANGVAAHALDFDDNCYAGFVHGSAVIVPAALAVAQARHAGGEALLTALVAGAECQYRVGMALGRALYDRGWWTTGLLGAIGACAATAKLLALDTGATGHALGLAIAGSGGMKCVFGSDAKPLLAGRAAESGVMAALLAEQGAGGPANALEHDYGLAALTNDGVFDAGWLTPAQGRWCLLSPGVDVKRIPVCLSSHAAVDGVLELVARHGLHPGQIAGIACDVPPVVAANLIYPFPRTAREGQFSLPFAIAASLAFGELTLDHLDDRLMTDNALVDLMGRVSMTSGARWADPALLADAPEGADVTITLRDGATLRCFVAKAAGSAARPLDDRALGDKFLRCAARGPAPGQAGQLLATLWRLRALSDVHSLILDDPTPKEYG